ncbi:MAG: diphthine--ammonia ligase [Candidatus Heimdallarchaeota archaeon]|nr:diphthine--ammonia ligase [Candidatus Heimdallarchaeota archaeon]
MRVSCLISGGKDSIYALWCALHQYEVISIINFESDKSESLLFHIPNSKYVSLIAEMFSLPLISVKIKSDNLKEEIEQLVDAIRKSGTEAIITGGIRSEFQRYHFNRAAILANVKCFNPLWRLSPELIIQDLINNRFEIILISVSSMGLNQEFLGKKLTPRLINKIRDISHGSDLAIIGEGGEYESFVLNAPFFPSRIVIQESQIHWNEFREEGSLEIISATLESKG